MKTVKKGSSSCSQSKDDSIVDYTSVLSKEDKRKRFSEELIDKELKEIMRLKKLYRQLQRQVHSVEVRSISSHIRWAKEIRKVQQSLDNQDFIDFQKFLKNAGLPLDQIKRFLKLRTFRGWLTPWRDIQKDMFALKNKHKICALLYKIKFT